jgi:hypothetical protein
LEVIIAGEHPSSTGYGNLAESSGEGIAMLERTVVYAYVVLLAISMLIEQPVPLAIAP